MGSRSLALLLLAVVVSSGVGAAPTELTVAEFGPGFSYRAFGTVDGRGRAVRFYLSDPAVNDDRPLVMVLQGSGCTSHFSLRDGRVSEGWQAFLRRGGAGGAQVLVVEKPGVRLFDRPARPGSAEGCSDEFLAEATEERWLAALASSVDAAVALRGRMPQQIAVIGHSEGAFFAPRLAAREPRVTHVAVLSGSPLSQLHDFFDMARAGEGFISQAPGTRDEHMARVLDAWANVDGGSADVSVFGHPARYWKGKFAPFDWTGLERSPAAFLVAHGDADRNSAIRTSDAFAIELLVRRRSLTWLRLKGADHSLNRPGDEPGSGLRALSDTVLAWMRGEAVGGSDRVWPRAR